MAYQATHWAWELDLPMAQKFTLVALADMADESFTCYPGQERIAKMIGSSISTVRRAVANLESLGLLTREERRREDGYRTSDRYKLQVGISPRKLHGENLTGQSARSHRSNTPDLTGHSEGVITSKNHQIEPPDKCASENAVVVVDPFDEFWSAYPIRKGKKQARLAYEKALKRATPEKILTGLRAYVASLGPNPDPSKVKWAQGWLNDDRWDDEHTGAPGRPLTNAEIAAAQWNARYGGDRGHEGDARALDAPVGG